VRQSKLFRMYESGNATKALLGQGSLQWDVERKQGAYSGRTFDAVGGSARGGDRFSGDGREVTAAARTQQEGGAAQEWRTSSSTYGNAGRV